MLDYPRIVPGRELRPDNHSPIVWALILSDAANNLRATLDFMAYQLAVKHLVAKHVTHEPSDTIQFPICDYPGNKRGQFDWFVKNRLADMLPSAIPTLERFQPYNRGNSPKNDLLTVLRELSNKTKHRFLLQPYLVGGVPGSLRGSVWLERLNNGDVKYVATRTNSAGEQEEFEPQLSFEVRIEIPSLTPTQYDISVLDGIYEFVHDDILPAFAGLF